MPLLSRLLFRLLVGLTGLLAILTVIASLRFFIPGLPAGFMAPHVELRPVIFLTHVGGGTAALALSLFQFATRRGPRRVWHRILGRAYVVACLAGGIAGLVLAFNSAGGPVAGLGFGCLAVLWLLTTGMGWRAAVMRDFPSHRRWMIRSMALTFAAVTLRLMIPASLILRLDFETAYPAIAFLCWIPNLMLAEAWIRMRGAATSLPTATAS